MREAVASPRVARRRVKTFGLEGLRAILERAGISEGRFTSVAASAIDALRPSRTDDPATQLTDAERAVLEAGGLDLGARRPGDRDPAVDTAARFAALLADSADVAEVAGLLRVTRARVRQRAVDRTLFAIKDGEEWRFPRAQFTAGAQLRGLSAVCAGLPSDLHPVAAWRFLSEPDPDLELDGVPVSPLSWLRSGGSIEPVIAIAREL